MFALLRAPTMSADDISGEMSEIADLLDEASRKWGLLAEGVSSRLWDTISPALLAIEVSPTSIKALRKAAENLRSDA